MAETADQLFAEISGNLPTTVKANQFGPSIRDLRPGALVQFTYDLQGSRITDRTPLVILTDVNVKYFRGLNLHYLTFPAIKKVLQKSGLNACNNPFFNYKNNIKQDEYIKTAFRRYKRIGVRRLKILNCDFVLNVMGSVRAIDPQEIQAIADSIKEQMQRTVQQTMPNMPQGKP